MLDLWHSGLLSWVAEGSFLLACGDGVSWLLPWGCEDDDDGLTFIMDQLWILQHWHLAFLLLLSRGSRMSSILVLMTPSTGASTKQNS